MFSNIDEKSLSHIPAVKALMAFGYELLNQEELKKSELILTIYCWRIY